MLPSPLRWLTFVVALTTSLFAQATTESGPITLRSAPLLFADDAGVARRAHLARTVHPAKTRREPVMVADQPWEHLRVYAWGSVHFDPATRKYAMWYMSRPPPPDTGTINLYATSDDGVRWTKPALDLFEVVGSKKNNVIGPGGGSLAVLVDAFEKNPARRFKLFAHRRGGYYAAYSADGIRWTEAAAKPLLDAGDTITLSQDANTGEYLAYHKRPHQSGGRDVRAVWLSRSRDFENWSKAVLVFAADATDQEWATYPDERTEVYDMSVYAHAAGFIGLPAMFRNRPQPIDEKAKAAGAVAADGPLDIQLATSADGTTWKRSWPRVAVIPRGEPGSFDGGAILNVSCAPVHTAEQTWVYYSAINASHGAPVPPKAITIGRAEWRRHGFVSLDAGPQGGEVETRPVTIAGTQLVVNADASRGELRVALLGADGAPLPGYDFKDCTPLKRDAVSWPVAWNGRGSIPNDRPLRVVVRMSNARLYSLESGSNAR